MNKCDKVCKKCSHYQREKCGLSIKELVELHQDFCIEFYYYFKFYDEILEEGIPERDDEYSFSGTVKKFLSFISSYSFVGDIGIANCKVFKIDIDGKNIKIVYLDDN